MGHNPFCTNETTFCTLWYDTIHPIILVSLTQPFRLLKLDEIHTVDSQSKWMIELHKISLGFFVAFDKNLQKNIWEGISSVCSISKDIFRFTAVAMSFIYMNKIEFFPFYMIKFNPFSVEHWNLLCISTEFCFRHFSHFHLFHSLPNFVIWKYVIRCTMSSISSMETKIDHIEFVSKTLQTQNRNSIELKCFSAPHYMWLLSSVTSFVHITAPFLSVPLFFRATNATFFSSSFHILDSIFAWEWINWNQNRKFFPANLWQRQSNSIKLKKKRENKTMRTLKHWSTSSCYLFFFHLFFFSWNFLVALFDIFSLQKKQSSSVVK